MSFFNSLPFKYLLPIVLLGLQFLLKFLVDRRATAFNFFTALLEIPVSILFLSLSLLAAFIIAGKGSVQFAFFSFPIILVVLLVCLLCWRRAVEHFEKKNLGYTACLGLLNFVLSIPILLFIINFLINSSI